MITIIVIIIIIIIIIITAIILLIIVYIIIITFDMKVLMSLPTLKPGTDDYNHRYHPHDHGFHHHHDQITFDKTVLMSCPL